jgi:hypothetical protein
MRLVLRSPGRGLVGDRSTGPSRQHLFLTIGSRRMPVHDTDGRVLAAGFATRAGSGFLDFSDFAFLQKTPVYVPSADPDAGGVSLPEWRPRSKALTPDP